MRVLLGTLVQDLTSRQVRRPTHVPAAAPPRHEATSRSTSPGSAGFSRCRGLRRASEQDKQEVVLQGDVVEMVVGVRVVIDRCQQALLRFSATTA
jgi:hypothetical protein